VAHIEEEHANEVCFNTEVKDANSIRHHLSDLWRAEWRVFGLKRVPEKDEELVGPTPAPGAEETGETRPCKRGKCAKVGDKFIEWPPSLEAQSTVPPSSRPKGSNRRKMTQVAPTGTTFIEWSPTAMAGSSDPSSGQHGGFCPDEHGLVAQSSPTTTLTRSGIAQA
jgi:hypothetical protein